MNQNRVCIYTINLKIKVSGFDVVTMVVVVVTFFLMVDEFGGDR
jgi:hypothetical protein